MSRDSDEILQLPSGARAYRYAPREIGFTPAASSPRTIEEVEAHLSRHFGTPETVFHEIASSRVHIDVQVVKPGPGRDHWTFFTTGMSDLPMQTPPNVQGDFRYAELIIKLPANWDFGDSTSAGAAPVLSEDDPACWPIAWLKQLARFPHTYNTWLGFGHTLPNGDPPQPFVPGTKLCAFLLLPPFSDSDDVHVTTLSDGRTVHFYVLHALHLEELSLKLREGTTALLEALERAGMSEVLDPSRPSAVRRRKLFGIL